MFFQKKLLSKITALEKELSSFQETQEGLRKEMLYFSLNADGKIVEANSLFLTSCGYEEKELIGKQLKNFMLKKSLGKDHCKRMFSCINSKAHWHGALQLETNSGKEACIEPLFNRSSLVL